MTVNDTKKAFLTKNVKLENETSQADINQTDNGEIVFSDKWSLVKNKFTNTKTEKIGEVSFQDLLNIPSGLVYDQEKQKLSFVDDSLLQTDSGGCPFEETNTLDLTELVSDLDVLEALDRINNFGSIYDFQFRQIDYGNYRYANAKLCTSFANSIGFFSIDKLINDEQIRRTRIEHLHEKFLGTEREEEFPPYSGFLVDDEYIENGWVSIDKAIHLAFGDDYGYDETSSLSIRTSRFKEAKRAWIYLTLSYVSDIYRLNSFNKLSDFGVRIVDKTTNTELDVVNIISNLPEAVAQPIISQFAGRLAGQIIEEEDESLEESITSSCEKIKKDICDGRLFTISENPNPEKEDGHIREFEAQVKVNPIDLHRVDRPDILNTVDAIHWTTGTQNLSEVKELKSLYQEFGRDSFNSGKLNIGRAFCYAAGEFDYGYAAGGYSNVEIDEDTRDIGMTRTTERWNGTTWSILQGSELNDERALGLAGGDPDSGVVTHGIRNSWDNPGFDNDFIPDSGNLVNNLHTNIFFSNKWITNDDVVWTIEDNADTSIHRHSVAGSLFIEYNKVNPGENVEAIYTEGLEVCGEVSSQAQTFASTPVPDPNAPDFLIANNDPRIWFDVWKINGIAFGGYSGNVDALDNISEDKVTDRFETISWSRIIKTSISNGQMDKIESNFGCWKVDSLRQYPIAALGICYVGDIDSGLSTGGKTAISTSQDVEKNSKINMWYAYADTDSFDENLLSVSPLVYENTGITWFRRDNLPEPVFYHTGVGNAEHSVFWGGIHSSLEEPQCYVSFKDCEDWEQMIREFTGAFSKNGMYSLDGTIRYSTFGTVSTKFDGNPEGNSDSWGNTYYRISDERDPSGLGVVYSTEYLESGNPTLQSDFPHITSISDYVSGDFNIPTKHLHAKKEITLTVNCLEVPRNVSLPTISKVQHDLINLKLIYNPDSVTTENIRNRLIYTINCLAINKDEISDYFSVIHPNVVITFSDVFINVRVFNNGESRVIKREDFPQPFIEFGATNSKLDKIGRFTKYVGENTGNFDGTFNFVNGLKNQFGNRVFAPRTNAARNVNYRYAGHPCDGGMWLWSRPTAGEAYFHPDLFFQNRSQPTADYISKSFANDPYTFYVANNARNLAMLLGKDDNDQPIFIERWNRPRIFIEPPANVRYLKEKYIDDDGILRGTEVRFRDIYEYGTSCIGSFDNYDKDKFDKVSLLEELSRIQFSNNTNDSISTFTGIDRWLNDVNFSSKSLSNFKYYRPVMYDDYIRDNFTGYFSSSDNHIRSGGSYRSSVIRDRALLFPWCDLLKGDASNKPVKGDSTWRWDTEGNFYYAFVEDVENVGIDEYTDPLGRDIAPTLQNYRQRRPITRETYRIIRYSKDGRIDFDYKLVYHDTPMELDTDKAIGNNRAVIIEVNLSNVDPNIINFENDINLLKKNELITRREDVVFDSVGQRYVITAYVSSEISSIPNEIRSYFQNQYSAARVTNSDVQVGRQRAIGDLFGTGIKSQLLNAELFNSRHLYGSEQNFEDSEITVSQFNFKKIYDENYTTTPQTLSESYPYKDRDLCSMVEVYDLYTDDDRYQVYLNGYAFGDNNNNDLINFTPGSVSYEPEFKSNQTNNIFEIPKQIINACGCGLRENVIRLKYYNMCLAGHFGVVFGDIRSMGEDTSLCSDQTVRSIIARGDNPRFDIEYSGVPGQPEYYLECDTTIPWYSTGIATDFTATMYARFRRDALGGVGMDDSQFVRNPSNNFIRFRTEYPVLVDNDAGPLMPFQVADPCREVDVVDLGLPANGIVNGDCVFPNIEDGNTISNFGKPSTTIFMGGINDIIYDKNFFETIYFLEEMAKMAQNANVLMVWTTIIPRPQLQYKKAIYNGHYFTHLVGEGNILNERDAISDANNPIPGDDVFSGNSWNRPIDVPNPYQGMADPFVGKTRLEKLVAINEWMKEVLEGKYGQKVIDAYELLANKNNIAGNSRSGKAQFTLSNTVYNVTFNEPLDSSDYRFDIRLNQNLLSQETEIIRQPNSIIAIVRFSFENDQGNTEFSSHTFSLNNLSDGGFRIAATDGYVGTVNWNVVSDTDRQKRYRFNFNNNQLEELDGFIYGDLKPEFSNGVFTNTPATQFNGTLNTNAYESLIKHITEEINFNPFLEFKIIDFDAEKTLTDANGVIKKQSQLEGLSEEDISSWLETVDSSEIVEHVLLRPNKCEVYPGECHRLDPLIHDPEVDSQYFDLLCCLLGQETCVSCFSECATDEDFSDDKFKWIQHNHEEWASGILESPFAGLFNSPDFNAWLTAGDVKNSKWGSGLWASIDDGEVVIHYRKQRLAISDENANSKRNHIYYATITAEIKIADIQETDRSNPTPVRVYYDEFIFDKDAYEGTKFLEKIRKEISQGQLSTMGFECSDNVCAFNPCDVNNLFGESITSFNACDSTNFAYSEWATNFVQEFKENSTGTEDIDNKTDKYYLKYDINRLTGSNTFVPTPIIDKDVELIDTEWRRYQDGVGLGGDAPILNVLNDDNLVCNELSEWFIGQKAFGEPNRAIICGGFTTKTDGRNNRSKSWWELLTTSYTFKWNKFVINPEDTFNKNYAQRNFSPFFTNNEPTSSKTSMGMILYDLADNILVERQGFAIFNNEGSVDVTLDLPDDIVNKDKYSIVLTPNNNVNAWWSDKTENGFVINVDDQNWTGRIDWQIVLNDRIETEIIDDENMTNIPFEGFEEL